MKRNYPLSAIRYPLKQILLLVSCCLLVTGLCACQKQELYKDKQVMMGTFVEVTSPDKRAANIVFKEIKRIEDLLSKYKEDSEISRLNKIGELQVSPDTLYIIKKAKEIWQKTNGAFDITVGPLIDLWGFTDKKYSIPSKQQIKEALKLVGCEKIIIDETNNVVKFKLPGMKIDLGGIAKGYAVDCAVKELKKNNIKSCLINAGGQIYALGTKFGRPWNVAVRDPRTNGVLESFPVEDKAVSTSGDYEQYFERFGKRYGHILDPKTGRPVDSRILSLTVIASDGLTTDALSTAIFVGKGNSDVCLPCNFPDAKVYKYFK